MSFWRSHAINISWIFRLKIFDLVFQLSFLKDVNEVT
jgi:hypothetical protein